MDSLRRLARASLAGALAGLLTLIVDELLALATLGSLVPISLRFGLVYLALGAALALAVEIGSLVVRRPELGLWRTFAITTALIYAPAIFERIHTALSQRLPSLLAIALSSLGVVALGVWILLLDRIAGARDRGFPWLMGAFSAAVGLAINRNLVDQPLETKAIFADSLVVLGILGLTFAGLKLGPRRVYQMLAALAFVVVSAAIFANRPAPLPEVEQRAEHPHLILLIVDTLRQDVFRAVIDETEEGRAFHEALDRAAWFDQAIAASPWTVPSMGSIMTGLYPQEHGFDAKAKRDLSRPLIPLPPSVPVLAEQLERRGYWTEGIVTNPLLQPVSGISRGFSHYEVLAGATIKLPPLTALQRLGLLKKTIYQPAAEVRARFAKRLDRMTATGQPIFLWLHLFDPHAPLAKHRDLSLDPSARSLPPLDRRYRDEVRYTLAELTRVIELLKENDLWDSSVVILSSDHGEMLPSDGHVNRMTPDHRRTIRYGHGHALFDELIRVPLVIRPVEGLPEERRLNVLTSHTDLWDTVADLLSLDDLPRIGRDRISLAPWLTSSAETTSTGRNFTLVSGIHYGPDQRALRSQDLKLIDYPNGEHSSELYRLDRDPNETRDVSQKKPRMLAKKQRRLNRLWSRLDPTPDVEAKEIDPETRERLKALGYL